MNKSSYCSTFLSAFDVAGVLDLCHSNTCVVVSHYFNLLFPNNVWSWVSLHMLIWHLCIIFSEVFTKTFCPCVFYFLFEVYLIDYAIIVVPFFPPLSPSALHPTSAFPTRLVHVHGLTCKFFGFSIVYTIVNLPVFFVPAIYATYSLYLFPHYPTSLPLPADNPPGDLRFCDSVPVLLVCLVCFCFYVQLLIVMSLLSFYCS